MLANSKCCLGNWNKLSEVLKLLELIVKIKLNRNTLKKN